MNKIVVCIVFLALLITGTAAQDLETYNIISTTGAIVDKRSGKDLQVGDVVSFHTELEFSALHVRAVLLSSGNEKYFLGLPKTSIVDGKLTVLSSIALAPVQNRSAVVTSISRSSGIFATDGLSPETLKKYFGIDTFTIVGSKFTLPVSSRDKEKYDLLIRYETEKGVEEYIPTDFTIDRDELKLQGNGIPECFLLLREGEKELPVKQAALFFVEERQLFAEFNALLKALKHNGEKNETREILRNYCFDVYGMIDRNVLETTINSFIGTYR